MKFQETDLATDLTVPVYNQDQGGGGGGVESLAEQLTGDTPPVVMQNFTPAEPSVPAATDTPASTTSTTSTAATPNVVLPSGLWATVKNSLGSAQSAVVKPAQLGLKSAAKAMGASEETAQSILPWGGPVLVAIVLAIAGTVYVLRRRIFSHHVTA